MHVCIDTRKRRQVASGVREKPRQRGDWRATETCIPLPALPGLENSPGPLKALFCHCLLLTGKQG